MNYEAIEWYEKAASRDTWLSIIWLMSHNGEGVDVNYEGDRVVEKAAKQGRRGSV